MERLLHPDVVWQGVRPSLVYGDRDETVANIGRGRGWRPDLRDLGLLADGDQVLLGCTAPTSPRSAARHWTARSNGLDDRRQAHRADGGVRHP